MANIWIDILIISYALVGIVSTLAYWPTIREMYFHKKKCANTTSYMLWTITSAISLLYSIIILKDVLVIIVSALGFLACAVIWILCIRSCRYRRK